MKCIFCKQDSAGSKSVEHIVPHSLGNITHTLPQGVVCDKCNQYFSVKIEKLLLEQPFFKELRFRNAIASKRGRIPKSTVLVPSTQFKAEMTRHNGITSVALDKESFEAILSGKEKHLIAYRPELPDTPNKVLSRFLAKIAIESLAERLLSANGGLAYVAEETEFDLIRDYARYGKGYDYWGYNMRKLYEEDEKFYFKNEVVDMIYECDFLITRHGEWYFCICLKGIEFVINLGGASLEGYHEWLAENNGISPLYTPKNINASASLKFHKTN